MKKCPYCAETIQEEAIVCKHCKRNLRGFGPMASVRNMLKNTSHAIWDYKRKCLLGTKKDSIPVELLSKVIVGPVNKTINYTKKLVAEIKKDKQIFEEQKESISLDHFLNITIDRLGKYLSCPTGEIKKMVGRDCGGQKIIDEFVLLLLSQVASALTQLANISLGDDKKNEQLMDSFISKCRGKKIITDTHLPKLHNRFITYSEIIGKIYFHHADEKLIPLAFIGFIIHDAPFSSLEEVQQHTQFDSIKLNKLYDLTGKKIYTLMMKLLELSKASKVEFD